MIWGYPYFGKSMEIPKWWNEASMETFSAPIGQPGGELNMGAKRLWKRCFFRRS